jgi:hypothetical protein
VKVNDLFRSKKSLAAADLRDEQGKARSIRVTIEDVTTQEFDDKGGKVVKPIIHFVGKEKTLVGNRTNCLRIIEAVGTDETDEWRGWSLVLYPTMVDGPKGRVDAIRIDDRPGAFKAPVKAAPRAVAPPDAPDEPFDELPDDSGIPF